jgi:hypothetical protein
MPFYERKDYFANQILSKAVLISLFFFLCTILLPSAFAATVNLAWNPSTGSNISGYKMYYGTSSRNYTYNVNVGNNTSCSLSGLTEGRKYYFAATAYNSSNVESVYSSELAYTIPTASSGTTSSSTPSSASGSSSTIIIDNGGPGTKASGSWTSSSGSGYYGTNSVYSKSVSSTYSFETSISGSQKVYLWWTYFSNRYTKVPVEIYDGSNLLATVIINQLQNGGKWNLIGTYTFSGKAKVVVVSKSSSSTTCADAVQFSPTSTATSSGSTSGSSTTSSTSSSSTTSSTSGSSTTSSTSGYTPSSTSGSSSTIIIDNGDPGTKASGSWASSSGSGYYGTNSVYSKSVSSTYSFEATCSGPQEVYLWWTYYSNRYTDVPVRIYDGSNLLDTIYINQLESGGKWNLLGTYTFSGKAKVVIFSASSTKTTSADAVRFVPSATASSSTSSYTSSSNSDSNSGASSSMFVIDNGDSGTSASGTWKISAASQPYGTESLYSSAASDTYSFETSIAGDQEVYLWWTEYPNRCTNVSVNVFDGTKLLGTVKNINQQQNGGQWNALGTYRFSSKAKVTIISSGGCTTSADAISFFTPN